MAQPTALTDPAALARNRARAAQKFLQKAAPGEQQESVAMGNKPFHSTAVVTGFPQVWAQGDTTIVADGDVLEIAQGAHDLVLHSLGLHWANDPVGQLIQCRRALKPDGLLLAASRGGQSLKLRRGLNRCRVGRARRCIQIGQGVQFVARQRVEITRNVPDCSVDICIGQCSLRGRFGTVVFLPLLPGHE